MMLELTKMKNVNGLQPNQDIQQSDWELFIGHIAKVIIEDQTPTQLQATRGKLNELLVHCIPPEVIMVTLTKVLLSKVDPELRGDVCKLAATFVCLLLSPR